MMTGRKLSTSLLLIFLFSCQAEISDRTSLNNYIKSERNGLVSKKKINQVDIMIKYLPWQLIALRYKSKEISDESIINKLKKNCFFILSFSKDGKELLSQLDLTSYSSMIQVLSFRMLEKINARSGDIVFLPEDCSFQQTFGLSGSNELLIVFEAEKVKNASEFKIEIDEFGLNLGKLVFELNANSIKSIHTLDYKNL